MGKETFLQTFGIPQLHHKALVLKKRERVIGLARQKKNKRGGDQGREGHGTDRGGGRDSNTHQAGNLVKTIFRKQVKVRPGRKRRLAQAGD